MKKIIGKKCSFFFIVCGFIIGLNACGITHITKQQEMTTVTDSRVIQNSEKKSSPASQTPLREERFGTLHIETFPLESQIRILNIKPKYYQNMKLEKGGYEIEVSKPGYHTVKKWVAVLPEIENKVIIRLEKKESQVKFVSKNSAYALIIGLSRYKYLSGNDAVNVMLADKDAVAFRDFLVQKGWDGANIKIFLDENAKKNDIHIALESWLMKAGPQDTVIVFWSGCIYPDPVLSQNSYFACYDTNTVIPHTGYRFHDIISSLKQKQTAQVILVADVYNLESPLENGRHPSSLKTYAEKLKDENKLPAGWAFFLCEMAKGQKGRSSTWPNSPFTHFILNGLKGAADNFENLAVNDNYITLHELISYLKLRMPDETKNICGVSIKPWVVFPNNSGDVMNMVFDIR